MVLLVFAKIREVAFTADVVGNSVARTVSIIQNTLTDSHLWRDRFIVPDRSKFFFSLYTNKVTDSIKT